MARVEDGRAIQHPEGRRGRGSASNASGRFERERRVALDDGWGSLDEVPPPLATKVTVDATRTIIARNDSPDVGFDRSINPYRGCEHGCIYCFARPSHAYLGLSPGLDFESRLLMKPDAARLLEKELSASTYTPRTMAMGTNTDPYQPIEGQYRITRTVLEVLAAFHHPVSIVTKSALITRDLDILSAMAEEHLAKVFLSVTTLDRKLARRMEPRAATPGRRLDAIRALSEAGVPVGVMVAPVIPALTDHEMEPILEAAAQAGAAEAGYVLLRLPYEIKDLFREWLEESEPGRAKHVISLLRQMHGGRDYTAEWRVRQRGTGPYADLIEQRFGLACRRFGLNQRSTKLDLSRFRRPPRPGDQLSLF